MMFLVISAIVGAVEFLSYRSMQRTHDGATWWPTAKAVWWSVSGLLWGLFIVNSFMWPRWRATHPELLMWISMAFIVVMVPKLVLATFQIAEEVRRLGAIGVRELQNGEQPIARSTFLSYIGQGAAALTFGSFLYGVTRGKYAYRVERHVLNLKGLPQSMAGMKVVQISDAHLGSFDGTPGPVLEALERINGLEPDLILFTGDLVNTEASEAEVWVEAFRGLKARLGKYSIMGNHDYADYGNFSEEERTASIQRLHEIHKEMGFRLLLNEHERIEGEDGALLLVGVENWGKGFRKSGDLPRALEGSGHRDTCTVLMSHDPTHWEEQVMQGKEDIELTLSGHTHGMQMGIEIPWLGLKVSPSKLRYSRWGGLYEEAGQFLHVNRGFGVLGFHGRVGMPPEITLLELQPKA